MTLILQKLLWAMVCNNFPVFCRPKPKAAANGKHNMLNTLGGKFSSGKIIRHLPKYSSLFSDENYPQVFGKEENIFFYALFIYFNYFQSRSFFIFSAMSCVSFSATTLLFSSVSRSSVWSGSRLATSKSTQSSSSLASSSSTIPEYSKE